MSFGILQRYVMGEILRAFLLALVTMTTVLMLFMVMAEAAKIGLSPRDIMGLVPFVIPSTLPYTIPVSILFSVTVVYGRLASDNEVMAVKASGVSAMKILWPALMLGGSLSVLLLFLSQDAIPRANHQAKLAIFKNFEDMFYKFLKLEREFTRGDWPFLIKVQDVDIETKTMYRAIFKHRNKKDPNNPFDMVVTAKKAVINFDLEKAEARVYLDGAEVSGGNEQVNTFLINDQLMIMPMPDKGTQGQQKSIQEWTTRELFKEQASLRKQIARERKRQAIGASLFIGSGRLEQVDWFHTQEAFLNYGFWNQRLREFETEKQLRIAQSFGSLIFVFLGSSVGILFAKRDFLSAFITCFMPIIVVYYPLMLLGINMGKEDVISPVYALWIGNFLLAALGGLVLPPILKH